MTRTERPSSSASRPPNAEPSRRSRGDTQALALRSWRAPERSASSSALRSDGHRLRGMFIDRDEITDRYREVDILGSRERIETKLILETRDNDRKAKRIKAGIQQDEVVR